MARPRQTTRKLEVFHLHLRNGDADVDYPVVFRALQKIPRRQRIQDRIDRMVALPTIEIRPSTVFLIAYEGPIGMKPLLFDRLRGTRRVDDLSDAEVVATRTHALVDLKRREVIVEYNQRGAKASDIAEAIDDIAARATEWKSLAVELNPVADAKFEEAVNDLWR